jgi:ubiquinone/menaquinone biosynthesis C-methylase UbiE
MPLANFFTSISWLRIKFFKMSTLKNKTPGEVIAETLDIAGKHILEVGSGEGEVTREMTQAGAHVIGVDPNPKQTAKVASIPCVGDETYIEAPGENLPFSDASADIVVFNNSLHHVPVDQQKIALEEAARVLKPGGHLFIAEPLAEGPGHELSKIFNDETSIRASAYEAIQHIAASQLKQTKEFLYSKTNTHESVESFRERSIRRDPHREAKFDENEDEIRRVFEMTGTKTDKGIVFEAPIRVNVLVKA